jgi:hypothetical protein
VGQYILIGFGALDISVQMYRTQQDKKPETFRCDGCLGR